MLQRRNLFFFFETFPRDLFQLVEHGLSLLVEDLRVLFEGVAALPLGLNQALLGLLHLHFQSLVRLLLQSQLVFELLGVDAALLLKALQLVVEHLDFLLLVPGLLLESGLQLFLELR